MPRASTARLRVHDGASLITVRATGVLIAVACPPAPFLQTTIRRKRRPGLSHRTEPALTPAATQKNITRTTASTYPKARTWATSAHPRAGVQAATRILLPSSRIRARRSCS